MGLQPRATGSPRRRQRQESLPWSLCRELGLGRLGLSLPGSRTGEDGWAPTCLRVHADHPAPSMQATQSAPRCPRTARPACPAPAEAGTAAAGSLPHRTEHGTEERCWGAHHPLGACSSRPGSPRCLLDMAELTQGGPARRGRQTRPGADIDLFRELRAGRRGPEDGRLHSLQDVITRCRPLRLRPQETRLDGAPEPSKQPGRSVRHPSSTAPPPCLQPCALICLVSAVGQDAAILSCCPLC